MGHTLEKRFKATKYKLKIRIATDGEAKEENSGYQCGDCNGVLATDVFDVDCVGSNERSGDTDDRCNSVVAVHDTVRRMFVVRLPSVLIKLWEEGIEKRVAHSNRCPAEPNETCCNSKLAIGFPKCPSVGKALNSRVFGPRSVHPRCSQTLTASKYQVFKPSLLADIRVRSGLGRRQ